MQLFIPGILTLLLTGAAVGQGVPTLPAAPGVAVSNHRWRKQVYNPALDDDPLRAGRETAQLQREKIEVARTNVILRQLGREPIPPPTKPSTGSTGIVSSDLQVTYVYEVKIGNTGTKTIRGILWEYVFCEPNTQQEVTRHPFMSKVNIGVGKSKKVVAVSTSPPARVVNVMKAGKDLSGQFSESVVVRRVDYDDGSFWEGMPE